MADRLDGWEKDAAGNIKLNPLTGYEAGVAFGMGLMLQVQFARSEGELRRGVTHKLALGMTPATARELAQVLLKKADQAEQRPETPAS